MALSATAGVAVTESKYDMLTTCAQKFASSSWSDAATFSAASLLLSSRVRLLVFWKAM
jgi:hypothetical protein